jgi:WD40 repeat protein
VVDVAWSTDGSALVSASVENTVILWDVAKARKKVPFCSISPLGTTQQPWRRVYQHGGDVAAYRVLTDALLHAITRP